MINDNQLPPETTPAEAALFRALWSLVAHLHRDGSLDAEEYAEHLTKHEVPPAVAEYLRVLSEASCAIEGAAKGAATLRVVSDSEQTEGAP